MRRSRYCETSVRSASPDATIHHPTAPCSAPSPKITASRPRAGRVSSRATGRRQTAQKTRRRQTAPEAMGPFPPVDGLELGERHAEIALVYCGMVLYLSNSFCQASSLMGGKVPVAGRHSVIDRPDSVRRVAPPTTTRIKTSAATARSQARIAMNRPSRLSDEAEGDMAREGCVMAGRPYTASPRCGNRVLGLAANNGYPGA